MRHIWLVIVMFLAFLPGCGSGANHISLSYFSTPDKIIVYQNGAKTIIENSHSLYSKILELNHSRFKEALDIHETEMRRNEEYDIKYGGLALEYVYSTIQKTNLGGHEKEYSRLLFPLTGFNWDVVFLGDNREYYSGPLGALDVSISLINLFNK